MNGSSKERCQSHRLLAGILREDYHPSLTHSPFLLLLLLLPSLLGSGGSIVVNGKAAACRVEKCQDLDLTIESLIGSLEVRMHGSSRLYHCDGHHHHYHCHYYYYYYYYYYYC